MTVAAADDLARGLAANEGTAFPAEPQRLRLLRTPGARSTLRAEVEAEFADCAQGAVDHPAAQAPPGRLRPRLPGHAREVGDRILYVDAEAGKMEWTR